MNGKNDLEESLGRKTSIGKNLFSFSARIQRIIQTHGGSFSNYISNYTELQKSNGHLVIKVETVQILWYRQRHISPGRLQQSMALLEHLVDKIKTAQIHRYRKQHISLGCVQHSSIILWEIYALFSLNFREQKGLKLAHPVKIYRTTKMTFSLLHGFSRKGFVACKKLSRRCQFQKIPSFPSGGNNHESPFQEDVPITIK